MRHVRVPDAEGDRGQAMMVGGAGRDLMVAQSSTSRVAWMDVLLMDCP